MKNRKEKRITKFFGAPFDPSNSPERLNLKIAYVNRPDRGNLYSAFNDPYDIVKSDLQKEHPFINGSLWIGKILVDSWLMPKPYPMDLQKLTFDRMASFFDKNGCWDYALTVAEYVHNVLPNKPIMIGIDHSLTGGSLLALSKRYYDLNVVVLDAHFDVVNLKDRGNHFGLNGKDRPIFYHCGNFLSILLENQIIQPKNLWILGVDEEILSKRPYKIDGKSQSDDESDVDKWLAEGVHLITKKMVSSNQFALDLNGPTYVSIDMDVGSLMSVYSARFMNCYGLNTVEFLNLVTNVKRSLDKENVSLVGLDMMEIDIHFLEAEQDLPYKDHTRYLAKKSIEILLEGELG